jgi:hypothetical protein
VVHDLDRAEWWDEADIAERPADPQQVRAVAALRAFFDQQRESVFSSRQIEVRFERQFFHWVTNRALRD